MSGTVLFDAPGPRARRRNIVITLITLAITALIVWVVYSRLDAKGQLTAAKWEPFLTPNLWTTYVLPGVQGTLTAAAYRPALFTMVGVLVVGLVANLLVRPVPERYHEPASGRDGTAPGATERSGS